MLSNGVQDQHEKISHSEDIRINKSHMLGKRRKLIETMLNLQVLNDTVEKLTSTSYISASCDSEYESNFCNSAFLSIKQDDESRLKKQQKYPLYGGAIRTLYSQQISEGVLKSHDCISNLQEPFRKNSIITAPTEDDLK